MSSLISKDKYILNLLTMYMESFSIYIGSYSVFLANSFSSNFELYKEHINNKSRKRYYNKLINITKKVSLMEKDSFNGLGFKKYKEILNDDLNNYYLQGNISKSKYMRFKKTLLLSNEDFIIFCLDEFYNNSKDKENNVKKNNKVKKIELPMLKETKKLNYILDREGLKVYHFKNVDDSKTVAFLEDSFEVEYEYFMDKFEKMDVKLFLEEDNLSSFEKKRRIYLQNVYNIALNISKLEIKKINITFPIDSIYSVCLDLVNQLYLENVDILKRNREYKKCYTKTIEVYGFNFLIKEYNKLFGSFKRKLNDLTLGELNEFKKVSLEIKNQSKYSVFKDVLNIIPSYEDIVIGFREKIFSNLKAILERFSNIEEIVDNIGRFLTSEDMVCFYVRMKEYFICNNVKLGRVVLLQEVFSKYLSKRLDTSVDDIISNYFKEDKFDIY